MKSIARTDLSDNLRIMDTESLKQFQDSQIMWSTLTSSIKIRNSMGNLEFYWIDKARFKMIKKLCLY